MQISQRAFEFISAEEVSDEATYNKLYLHTEWPGGASGVTIGIGFDLGMSSVAEVREAWAGVVPAEMIRAMCSAVGVTGLPAKALALELSSQITIPYATARLVFEKHTIPHEEAKTRAALPNCGKLSGDSFGALVSLTYNRGASYGRQRDVNDQKDRYLEMRQIKTAMALQEFQDIPGYIENMQRLWQGMSLDGLLVRRQKEAQMFEEGIGGQPIGASLPPKQPPAPPPQPPAPSTSRGFWAIVLEILSSIFGGKK